MGVNVSSSVLLDYGLLQEAINHTAKGKSYYSY